MLLLLLAAGSWRDDVVLDVIVLLLLLSAGSWRDDMVLEVIVLVGTVCNDDACAKMLAQAGVIQTLIELLNGNSNVSSSSY